MNAIQKVSEETLLLEKYILSKNHGDKLSYSLIEKESGVKMDDKGKERLRSALKRSKKEYECEPNIGIILASPKNASKIIIHKLVKVDNAVKRGEKSYKNISKTFYDELPAQEQKQLNFIGAAFGAIRLAAENGRKILTDNKVSNNKKIELPNKIY